MFVLFIAKIDLFKIRISTSADKLLSTSFVLLIRLDDWSQARDSKTKITKLLKLGSDFNFFASWLN